MNRKNKISLGEYYHVYNRGVDKRKIFNSCKDKDRFLKLLYLCNSDEKVRFNEYKDTPLSKIPRSRKIVSIGVYCLMDNHFHLLIKERKDGGISKFMEKLTTAYVMYFNKKNERTGALFEGRFKAKYISKDSHLKHLYCYIHFNPLKFLNPEWKKFSKKDICHNFKFLCNYHHSSFPDYLGGGRDESVILDADDFPLYFLEQSFEKHVMNWLSMCDESKER